VCNTNGEKRNAYGLLVGKTPLGRPRGMWVDNIKMDRLGWCDWIGLAQDRDKWRPLVNLVMNHWVASNAGKLLRSLVNGGLLRSAQLLRVS
jgi:hypothetical protein